MSGAIAAVAVVLSLGLAGTALANPPSCTTSPHVTSVSPTFGTVLGGTSVTITGTGFCSDNLRVFFGANKVTKANTNFVSSTEIDVVTPASAFNGPVNVRVQQNTQAKTKQSTLANGFTYTCAGCTVSPVSLQFEGVDTVEQTAEPNGVLEPGESTVAIKTKVINSSAVTETSVTGAVTNITGPQNGAADITYNMNDSAATYTTLTSGASADCGSDCYAATITIGGSGLRPTVNVPSDVDWDATMTEQPSVAGSSTGITPIDWRIHVGQTFTDVSTSNNFYDYIERLVHNHVTFGTNAANHLFSPGTNAIRGQMAAFISRGFAKGDANVPDSGTISGNDNNNLNAAYNCTNGGTSLFADVAATDQFCKHIHYIAGLNVTTGCPYPNFCEATPVTRRVMSVFISRTLVEPLGDAGVPDAYGPDPNTGRSYDCTNGPQFFPDVALGGTCKNIGYIWALGIVDGNNGSFLPDNNVTRAAMSKFLDNAFQLTIGPAE